MGIKIIEVSTPNAGLKMVLNERAEGFITLEDVADYIVEKNYLYSENIEKSKKPFKIKNYYLMFSHGFYESNRETSDRIWNLIQKYVEAGKMKELYYKWAELTQQ
jgi:polar amino acid transport system substrate-binding protein